jgi:hypothetical protein
VLHTLRCPAAVLHACKQTTGWSVCSADTAPSQFGGCTSHISSCSASQTGRQGCSQRVALSGCRPHAARNANTCMQQTCTCDEQTQVRLVRKCKPSILARHAGSEVHAIPSTHRFSCSHCTQPKPFGAAVKHSCFSNKVPLLATHTHMLASTLCSNTLPTPPRHMCNPAQTIAHSQVSLLSSLSGLLTRLASMKHSPAQNS